MAMCAVSDSGSGLGLIITPGTGWTNDDPIHQYMHRQSQMNGLLILYAHVIPACKCNEQMLWLTEQSCCISLNNYILCHSKLSTYWNLQMPPKCQCNWVSAAAVDALELKHRIISICNIDSPPWIWLWFICWPDHDIAIQILWDTHVLSDILHVITCNWMRTSHTSLALYTCC